MRYTLEKMREVWHDSDGSYNYEVGPDRDGTGCVELRYREDGKIGARMSFAPEQAKVIAQALIECAEELLDGKVG